MLLSLATEKLQTTMTLAESIKTLSKIGFDAYDMSLFEMFRETDEFYGKDYLKKAKELRNIADCEGIVCNQSHAPFYGPADKDWQEIRGDLSAKSIEITAILGGKICVVHPDSFMTAEENAEKIYYPLEKYAKETGVKIATENMWLWNGEKDCAIPAACYNAERFAEQLKYLSKKNFCACVDIGHAAMFGSEVSPEGLITELSERVESLHIHESDGRHDLHACPYSLGWYSGVKWDEVFCALKKIAYKGDFTFEIGGYIGNMPTNEAKINACKTLLSVGRSMIEKIEK